MYLDIVSKFTVFLSTNERTLDEILSHIVKVVLAPLSAPGVRGQPVLHAVLHAVPDDSMK